MRACGVISFASLDERIVPGSVAKLARPSASAIANNERVPVRTQILAASISRVSMENARKSGGVKHCCRSYDPRLTALHGGVCDPVPISGSV
jgi:hypothetical protein